MTDLSFRELAPLDRMREMGFSTLADAIERHDAEALRIMDGLVAERDRYREALHQIVLRCVEVPLGAPAYPLARGVGEIAAKELHE